MTEPRHLDRGSPGEAPSLGDLTARLAQRPLAPDPKLNGPYFDYLQRKRLEFDRDLALDALLDIVRSASMVEECYSGRRSENLGDALRALWKTEATARTILAALRGSEP